MNKEKFLVMINLIH